MRSAIFGGLPVLAPAMQHVRDLGIRKQRCSAFEWARFMVTTVRQAADLVGAAIVGRDPHPAGRVDEIGGVAPP